MGGARRHSPEPTKIPAAEEPLDGSGGNAGTNWGESDVGSSRRDIVIRAQPTAPRIGVADEAVCGSAPTAFVRSFGVSRRPQSGAVSHGSPLGLVEQPHLGNTVAREKQEAVQDLPRGREEPSGDETNDVSAGVLIEAGKPAVNTLAPTPIHTTELDRQIVPYLGNGGAAVWRTECATVQTVDIAFPAEPRSSLSQDGATPPQPKLDLKSHRSGGRGGSSSDRPSVRYEMTAQATDDDVSRASSPGACIRERLDDRSVSSLLRRCHPPPRAPSAKGATMRGGSGWIDGEGPNDENRMVPFSFGRSVVNNVASEIEKGVTAVGGTPPLWGKGDALGPEKPSEGECSAQPETCQRQHVLGPTGSAPTGTRLCLPRQESTSTCPNAAKVLRATKPFTGARLPEKQEGHGEGVVSAEPRTLRVSSPQIAAACTRDVVCVDDQPDDKVLASLVGKPVSKRSGRRDVGGRTTLPRTVSDEYRGHIASDRQPEDGTLVPLEGHGRDIGEPRMPAWRGNAAGPSAEESRARSALQELPRRRSDALTVTASSSDSPGPSTSPSSPCLLLPLPCTPSLLQLEATGEAVMHGNGREKGEVCPAEPMAPAVSLGGDILEGSTTRTAPTGPLAASSAAEFSRQAASSEGLPLSPPALRSKQPIVATVGVGVELGSRAGLDSSVEQFSPPTTDKDASSPLPPPLVHYRRPYWSTGVDAASKAGIDRENAEHSCMTPAAPPDNQAQGASQAAAETAPAIAKHERIANSAIDDRQPLREGQQQQQQQHGLESAMDLGSHVEPIARSSDQSDGSNFARKGGLQRHLQRYPPPPGPPPSPIRALRQGNTSPKTASSSISRRHRERSARGQDCGRLTNQVVAEGTIAISPPTTTEDEAHDLYYRSPRSRKNKGRSTTADSQEDTALLDLAEVAVSWLPPPTPPPPEARRRRRQRASMPPPSTSSPCPSDCNVEGSTGTPPSPPPPCPRNGGSVGGKKDGYGEDSNKHSWMSRDSSRWAYGRCQSVARVDGTPPKDGCRGEMRPTGGATAATETTTPAEEHKDTDGRRGGEEFSGELLGNRNLEESGGWAGSDEGSAARRRAGEVLARISALEVYFDRVEDQVVRTPPAPATAGNQVPERVTLSKGRSSDAAESNSCSDSTLGVGKRGGQGEILLADVETTQTEGHTGDDSSRALARGDRPSSPSPLPKDAQTRTHKKDDDKEEVLSSEECAVANFGLRTSAPRRPNDAAAVPPAMPELSLLEEGRGTLSRGFEVCDIGNGAGVSRGGNGDSSSGGTNEQHNKFYFDVGRTMMLDTFHAAGR
ncbi:unnamed protein product [Ectocarpus sp. 4 AP-2014]